VIFEGPCDAVAPRKTVLALYLVFPVAIGLAAWRDQSLFLPGYGAGFFEHLGAWVLFVTTPVMIALTARGLRHFLETFAQSQRFLRPRHLE